MAQVFRKKLIIILIVLKRDRGKSVTKVMESYFTITQLPADSLEMVIYRTLFARIAMRISKYRLVMTVLVVDPND